MKFEKNRGRESVPCAEVSLSGMASLALKKSFTWLVGRCPGKIKFLSLLEFVPQRSKELTHKKNNCRKRGLRFVAGEAWPARFFVYQKGTSGNVYFLQL